MTTPPGPPAAATLPRHGTLPQLAAFEAVVRLGSATRAAEALCIAQPTLSGHLRKLGEALGVRLFELRGKRLVPDRRGQPCSRRRTRSRPRSTAASRRWQIAGRLAGGTRPLARADAARFSAGRA